MARTESEKKFYRSQFKRNFRRLPRMVSAWIVIGASAAATYWLQLDAAKQAELLVNYPFLKDWAPTLTAVAWIWARVQPQKSLTPMPKEEEQS